MHKKIDKFYLKINKLFLSWFKNPPKNSMKSVFLMCLKIKSIHIPLPCLLHLCSSQCSGDLILCNVIFNWELFGEKNNNLHHRKRISSFLQIILLVCLEEDWWSILCILGVNDSKDALQPASQLDITELLNEHYVS